MHVYPLYRFRSPLTCTRKKNLDQPRRCLEPYAYVTDATKIARLFLIYTHSSTVEVLPIFHATFVVKPLWQISEQKTVVSQSPLIHPDRLSSGTIEQIYKQL